MNSILLVITTPISPVPAYAAEIVPTVTRMVAVSTVSRSVQPYVLMWNAQNNNDRVQYAAQMSTNITCILAGLITVGFVPFAEPFINWWLDRSCFPGMPVLIFVTSAFLLDALFISSVNFIIVLNQHKKLALFLVAKSILLLAMGTTFAVYSTDPTTGVAFGIFLATLISNLGMPFLFQSAISTSKKTYYDRFLIRPIAYFVIILSVAVYTAGITNLSYRIPMGITIVFAAMLLAWLTLFSSKDRQVCIDIYNKFRHTR